LQPGESTPYNASPLPVPFTRRTALLPPLARIALPMDHTVLVHRGNLRDTKDLERYLSLSTGTMCSMARLLRAEHNPEKPLVLSGLCKKPSFPYACFSLLRSPQSP
jgi:hypothetical protein